MRAGFLTSSSSLSSSRCGSTPLASAPPGTAISISSISRAASGSITAVGGENAIYDAGGRGGVRSGSSQHGSRSVQEHEPETRQIGEHGENIRLSFPNMGPYLKLVTAARSHMVSLIMKSRYQEMPLYLFREKWDGGVSANGPTATAKKYRGEFNGVSPSRTPKWKQFYGLSFDWVLAECLGAGLIEIFETGSVGRAARTT